MFAEKRLRRIKGMQCSEARIIQAFRRSNIMYRSPDTLPDKKIRSTIRQWVGYKTNMNGDYLSLEIINRKKEADAAIALKKQIIASQISVDALIGRSSLLDGDITDGDDDDESSDNEGTNLLGSDFVRPTDSNSNIR